MIYQGRGAQLYFYSALTHILLHDLSEVEAPSSDLSGVVDCENNKRIVIPSSKTIKAAAATTLTTKSYSQGVKPKLNIRAVLLRLVRGVFGS